MNRDDTILLLRALGDSDPEGHWNLFNAARILLIVGVALFGAAALIALCEGCFLPTRLLIIIPLLLTLGGVACSVLAPIFWGVLQRRAFDQSDRLGYDTKLGYSWILSVIATGLGLAALPLMLLGCCRHDPAAAKRRSAATVPMAAPAAGAGTHTEMQMVPVR